MSPAVNVNPEAYRPQECSQDADTPPPPPGVDKVKTLPSQILRMRAVIIIIHLAKVADGVYLHCVLGS